MAHFTFDGRAVPFHDGDTVASALHRSGELVLSRSMKYHRPRGLYCCTGSCASCFVTVDGVPNTPACTAPAADRTHVVSQNRLGSARHDALRIVDIAYPAGFDPHAAFTRPGVVNRLFVKAVRRMSGWGPAPPPGSSGRIGTRRQMHVEHLIVGGGRAGLQAARDAKGPVLLVEEQGRLGGSALLDPSEQDTLHLATAAASWDHLEVWTDALAFGIYDGTVAVRRGHDLWEFTADRITMAPGHHDGMPVFVGNDLPGILSLRGAKRLWYQHGVLPGRCIIGHGQPLPARFVRDLEHAGATVVAEGTVTEAEGGTQVERVHLGERRVRADTIICNLPGIPRIELFQQAGCELGWQGRVVPVLGPDGATSVKNIHGAFGGT